MRAPCTDAAAVPCEVISLGEAATNLMNDVRIREIFINRGYCECDGVDSMSSCSLSSDLGDTWHHGPPTSPRWAGGLELGTNDHSETTAEEECEDWSSDEKQQGITSVKCEKALFGLHSVTVSLWPMCLSYARRVQSGIMLNCMENLQNYGSS